MPRHDIVTVMDDLNAKIGSKTADYKEILGRHSVGVLNNSRQRLLEFYQLNDLVVGVTLFEHKDIHNFIWNAPNGKTENQIDYFCIKRRFRHSLLDVRDYRGADIDSDHQLVIAKLELKLKAKWTANIKAAKRLKTENLKNPITANKFKQNLLTNPEHLKIEGWNTIKKAFIDSTSETVGYTKKEHKKWNIEPT